MKTQEEIEQLAEKYYPPYPDGIITDEIRLLREGFIKGCRCLEDIADKIKDGYACMPSINSLNKQD
jgi:hypothetical protein